MIKLFSIEFWIVIQLFIDLLLVLLVWALVRKLKKVCAGIAMQKEDFKAKAASIYQEVMEKLENSTDGLAEKSAVQMIDRAAQDIIDLLDPLVKGSESAARAFDTQIKEKQRLVEELNGLLDSRIISINMLLSRADVLLINQAQNRDISAGHQTRDINGGHENRGIASGYRNQQPEMSTGFSGAGKISDFKDGDPAPAQIVQNAQGVQLAGEDILDQQQKIVELYQKGMDVENIASRLSMPRGEVQLVVNLKEKFIRMENQF